MSLIIGLTGSIASGKSTVSDMLAAFNIPLIDADEIARQVVEPCQPAYHEIVKVFGDDILHVDQTLHRKKLGTIVFADEEKRRKLNEIVHPAIRKEMQQQKSAYINSGEQCIVLDIPLLFENKLETIVDRTIVVYVDKHIQIERLMARDRFSRSEAIQRISSQIPLCEKIKRADAIINNNGTMAETRKQLIELLRQWQVIKYD